MSEIIHGPERAIEHATSIPGLRPVRLFSVLWPLWQVEVAVELLEEQAYDLVDRFLVRAVLEAGWSRPDELARFYGLPEPMVDRCLDFLARIGHVRLAGDAVLVTELGARAARADVRLVRREVRRVILIERFTRRPLPYSHDLVQVLPAADEERTQQFQPLYSASAFRPQLDLTAPAGEQRVLADRDGYLPVHLVETADGEILAYSQAVDGRDAFLEAVCAEVPVVRNLLAAETSPDQAETWTRWAAEGQGATASLSTLPSGVWRATLAADRYGEGAAFPLALLGSFTFRGRQFLQLWCADETLRRRALLGRAVAMAAPRPDGTLEELLGRVAAVARLLEVEAPGLDEIRRHAEAEGRLDRVAALDAWEAEPAAAAEDGAAAGPTADQI